MSESKSKTTGGAHILVYPFPSSGHVIPILDLTHQLLARGLTVTVAVTQKNLPLLDPFLHQVHHLLLPEATPESLPPSKIGLISYMRFFRDAHYPILLDWFHSHHQSLSVVIISDFFLCWTQDLASRVGARRVVFSPSSALTFSVMISNWRHLPRNDDDDPDFLVSHPEIPNCPKEPWWQISRIHKMAKEDDDAADLQFIKNCFLTNLLSWGIVFNSFAELEGVFLDHVKKQYGNDNVWAVGPLMPSDHDLRGTIGRGGPSSLPCHEVLTWLDSCKKEHSVVYVCFGSRTVLRCKQMNELAAGLENSGVHFVFCFRNPEDGRPSPNDPGTLPDGFEDRVAGRGFVIKGWAPQMAILRHGAVGAFLTHCGWNSVLEGIAAGVVMLTWPMAVDQFLNAKLLVDELGVGIPVGEATQNIPNSDELSRVLRQSVQEGRPERVKVKKIREAALGAVRGGSSDEELDEFVKRVNEI